MRSSLKSVIGVGSVGAILALVAMPAALAQPENPRPRLPGQAPRVPAQPGEGQQPGGPGRGPGEGGQRQPTVDGAMRQMNRALTMYEESAAEGKDEEALLAVYSLERACASAKLVPAPEDVTKEQVHAYREALLEVMKLAVELEEAQFTGDAEKAAELLAEIKELRDETHKAFGVEEHEEGEEPAQPQQPQQPGRPGGPRPGRGG